MPIIKYRKRHDCHSCANCCYLSYKSKHPADVEHPEPFCPKTGINLMPHVNRLYNVYCNQWEALPDYQAVKLFEELIGMKL